AIHHERAHARALRLQLPHGLGGALAGVLEDVQGTAVHESSGILAEPSHELATLDLSALHRCPDVVERQAGGQGLCPWRNTFSGNCLGGTLSETTTHRVNVKPGS